MVATLIKFVGDINVIVEEDVEVVQQALDDSDGQPVPLTLAKPGRPVYVIPANVAYWHAPLGSGAAQFH